MSKQTYKNPPLGEHAAGRLADLFRTLSDPTRLRLIALLLDRELNVGELAGGLALSESAVSHQLRDLRLQRVVRARRQGRRVYYALDDAHVKALFQLGREHQEHA